jgi:uncharacterized membrane protein YfcA
MVVYIVCSLVALLASGLTFFSGFGLGTLLTPVFALFFPIEIAITITSIVHFLNNLFKLTLTYRNINSQVLISFGIAAFIAAMIGALVLNFFVGYEVIFSYHFLNRNFDITALKLGIGLMIIFFTLFESYKPKNKNTVQKNLFVGGLLSGFCGGLSGNQGALRSMFLNTVGMSKESFIATGIAIACLTDISRMSIYIKNLGQNSNQIHFKLVLTVTLFAFVGALIGNKLLRKTTLFIVNKIVMAMLLIIGLLMCLGIV